MPPARRTCLQGPYIAIAAALLVLGFAVMFMHLPAITSTQAFRPAGDGDRLPGRSIWTYAHTVLGMVGIFFYVGVEIALAAIAIRFFQEQGISSLETAGLLVTLYYLRHHGRPLPRQRPDERDQGRKDAGRPGHLRRGADVGRHVYHAARSPSGAWCCAAWPTPSCIPPSLPWASPNWDR